MTPWTIALQTPLLMETLHKRIEWIPIPFSRWFSQPRNWTESPASQEDYLPCEPPRKFQWKKVWKCQSFSHVWLCKSRTIFHQAPLTIEFSRHEYWNRLPLLLQRTSLTQGLNPGILHWRQILYCLSHPMCAMCLVTQKFLNTSWDLHLGYYIVLIDIG